MSDKPTYTRKNPCIRCHRPFDPALWYTNWDNGKLYWKSICAPCTKELSAGWQKDNPRRQAANNKRYRLNKSLRRQGAA